MSTADWGSDARLDTVGDIATDAGIGSNYACDSAWTRSEVIRDC